MSEFDFLGRGPRFPFEFDHGGGLKTSRSTFEKQDHIKESVIQILGTKIGERFLRPEFGSRLHELVFESNDHVLKAMLAHYIREALGRWEKRLVIDSILFPESSRKTDQNVMEVEIGYTIIKAQVTGNLVYPFYRETT